MSIAGKAIFSWQKNITLSMIPWEKEGKLSVEYTREEYQMLDPEEKDAFFENFESEGSFDA